MTLRHRLRSAEFPRRLREARRRAGLLQDQLAAAAGYSNKQTISALELGRQGCTTAACARLAKATGVTVCWLGYGLDEPEGAAEGYGERLRQARDRAGLTMERLSQLLGYASRSSIAELESEHRTLDLALAETTARVLGVSATWLAFGAGDGPGGGR